MCSAWCLDIKISIYFYTVVPIPSITVSILNNETVGQSLTLECDVATVRGITSRLDIAWSSDSSGQSGLRIVYGTNANSITNNSVLFTNTYIIPQLSTANENEKYQCEVLINTDSPVIANDSVILNVTGKYILVVQ